MTDFNNEAKSDEPHVPVMKCHVRSNFLMRVAHTLFFQTFHTSFLLSYYLSKVCDVTAL